MVPSASNRRIIRTVVLILLLTAPFLLGTPPFDPCHQIVVSGRIKDASNTSIDGATISLEAKLRSEKAFSADRDFGYIQDGCPADFPNPIIIDTTEGQGSYLLRGGFYIDGVDKDYDSLRLVVRMPNDSIVYGEPFAVSDTTSAVTIYLESSGNPMSGSGCSCSSQPYIAGYIYRFEGRDVVVP